MLCHGGENKAGKLVAEHVQYQGRLPSLEEGAREEDLVSVGRGSRDSAPRRLWMAVAVRWNAVSRRCLEFHYRRRRRRRMSSVRKTGPRRDDD